MANLLALQVQPVDAARSIGAGLQIGRQNRLLALKEDELTRGRQANALVPEALSGDEQALSQLTALNPDLGIQVRGERRTASEQEQKKVKFQLEVSEQLLGGILSLPPEQRPAAYQDARVLAQQAGMDMTQIPAQYDENWARRTFALVQDANRTFQLNNADNENERQIQALTNRGFSRADAEDIAYGFVTVSPPDKFGNVYLVNKATGESRPVSGPRRGVPPGTAAGAPGSAAPSAPAEEPRPSIEEAAQGGTGPYANIFAAYDAIVGGFLPDALTGGGSLAPETQAYRQQLRVFNQIAKTALVNNPRFPVAEQELVAKLLPNPETIFTNPDTEAQRAQQLRQTLLALKEQNQRSINAGNITQEQLALLADKNAEIDRILGLMGPAQQQAAPEANISTMTLEQLNQMDVSQMSDEELAAAARRYDELAGQ